MFQLEFSEIIAQTLINFYNRNFITPVEYFVNNDVDFDTYVIACKYKTC